MTLLGSFLTGVILSFPQAQLGTDLPQIAIMTLTGPRSPLHQGVSSVLYATVTNVSPNRITFTEGESGGQFDLKLYDDEDPAHKDLLSNEKQRAAVMPSTLGGHDFAFSIEPGETVKLEFILALRRIQTHPGTYTLVVTRPDFITHRLITAAPLQLTIAPPKEKELAR